MKRKHRLFTSIIAVMVAFSCVLSACGGSAESASEDGAADAQGQEAAAAGDGGESGDGTVAAGDISIGVVLASTYTEFWSTVESGVQAAADDLGVQVIIVAPSSESDVAGQVGMVEDMVSRNMDALVVSPVDSTSLATPLYGAIEKGIPVILFDSDTEENRDVFVGISNHEAAASVAPVLAEVVGEGGKYVIIGGLQGHQADTGRCGGFEEAVETANGELLDLQNGDWTADKAMEIMENFLQRYPEIDAVLCASDNTALGALRAVQASGRDIQVVGFDANESAVQEVIDGNMLATVSQDAFNIGYTSLASAVRVVQGETLDEFIYVPTQLVTADNAQEYYDSMWG